MTIGNKHHSYLLFDSGAFGNKPRTWRSLPEMVASGYTGQVSMRTQNRTVGGSGLTAYNVKLEDIPAMRKEWIRRGIDPSLIRFNESMPDDRIILQGDVQMDQSHYSLVYSTLRLPMNKALAAETRHAHDAVAMAILRHVMCAASYENLQSLFDAHPTSVVEFSTFECSVGLAPNMNTIFWEVRNY